jgi:hypothetical protein
MDGTPALGHLLPLTLANWVTAMWPIAVIRPKDLSASNAAKADGHLWAASARQSKKLGCRSAVVRVGRQATHSRHSAHRNAGHKADVAETRQASTPRTKLCDSGASGSDRSCPRFQTPRRSPPRESSPLRLGHHNPHATVVADVAGRTLLSRRSHRENTLEQLSAQRNENSSIESPRGQSSSRASDPGPE